MAETIRGINVIISGETTGLTKALEDVNKKSKAIQGELKQVEKLLKFDPSNTELLAQRKKLLADAVENAREKLDRLRAVQEQVNQQFAKGEISERAYREFQREVAATEQELKKLEAQFKSMEPVVESFGDKLQKAGDKLKTAGEKMTDIGKKMSVGITAPIVGIGTAATKAAIDFESAFAGVRKTVDATEEEFAALEKGIREMSQRMPASATDIAAVAEAAGQLGIETDNILKFTEVMIGLGEATNLTAEEGATQFARFANIVGMSQQDFDRLGSAVVALGNSFATTEAEIVAMGMRLAGQGAQIGMTEAQIMALAAAMSSVGIEAEAGGTAMSTVLKRMQNAVSLAGEDLEKFAAVARMSAEEFAKAFQEDPAAALQAFIDGLATSSAAGENLTLILNDLGITGIRESDTLLRLAGANDVLRSAVETATTAWEENVALQNEVAQRYETTESKLQMFKNQVTDLSIEIGETLVPALMAFVDMLRPLVDWFKNLSPEAKKVIIAIAGIAAAIGPLLIVLGSMATGISSIISILPALGTALTALTGPVGLVIAAVTALIAIWATWGDDIKRIVSDAIEKVKTWFVNFRDNITETLSALPERLKQIGTDLVAGLWQGILDKFEWFKTRIAEFGENVKNKFKEIFGISSPSKVLETYGQYLAEGLAKGLEENSSKTTRAATKMADEITLKVAAIQDAVTKTVEGISLQTQIMQAKFDLWKAKFGETASASEMFRQEMELQKAKMDEANQKVEVLTVAYEDMKRVKGETAAETQKLYQELLKVQTAQAELQKQIEKTTKAYHAQADAIQRLLSSKNRADVELGATMAYIESTGRIPSKSGGGGGLYESATKVQEQREKEKNDPHFQRNLQALLDFGMGIEEAVERLRHAERTGTQITQNITINSPTPLSPSETARQIKNASRQLAMEW